MKHPEDHPTPYTLTDHENVKVFPYTLEAIANLPSDLRSSLLDKFAQKFADYKDHPISVHTYPPFNAVTSSFPEFSIVVFAIFRPEKSTVEKMPTSRTAPQTNRLEIYLRLIANNKTRTYESHS